LKKYIIKINKSTGDSNIGIRTGENGKRFGLKEKYEVTLNLADRHSMIDLELINDSEKYEVWETKDKEGEELYNSAKKEHESKNSIYENSSIMM